MPRVGPPHVAAARKRRVAQPNRRDAPSGPSSPKRREPARKLATTYLIRVRDTIRKNRTHPAPNHMATKTAPSAATRFPHPLRLPGGSSLTLRLMDGADRDEVLEFARSLPAQDTLFLRMDIADPLVVDEWIKNIGAGRPPTGLAR